jgi:hypothetical protein
MVGQIFAEADSFERLIVLTKLVVSDKLLAFE